ncbi:hypothetical protein HJG60_012744 [Phyllostomus discolor]|uniref:Mannose-binding protein A-like n=1 Tax=Phyllostomus discolor TaxID=89673 RepID=A0A834AFN3_9CHIR|nr:hypothetical protein HJG60_012744 [Phyllostomus discolor]
MFQFSSLPVLLCVMTVSCSEIKSCEDAQKTCSVITCGIPVTNGSPGRDGRDGPKGEKGEPGTAGWARAQRLAGPSGENGASRNSRSSWISRTKGPKRRSWRQFR